MKLNNKNHKCRICNKNITNVFCDLGYSPLANTYPKSLKENEIYYPLKVFFCNRCKLPQLPEHQSAKIIFKKYDYFSSYSSSWIDHSQKYVKEILKFSKFKKDSKICEIASNDGYLLQFFKKKGFTVLGVEPAKNVADVAIKKGINTEKLFFGTLSAKKIKKKYGEQDLIIANNVLAHVPNILDFCAGIKHLISKEGMATFEFPHFYNLINKFQFDTIYHEHFSYLTVHSIHKLFSKFQLEIFNIKKINTHGGSLRVFVKNKKNKRYKITSSLNKFLRLEKSSRIFTSKKFSQFNNQIQIIKKKTTNLLIDLKLNNKKIVAYGAPAKGNTFLNYCMLDKTLIKFTVDKNPSKIGKFLPGSHIPILHPSKIIPEAPDYIFILPWNLSKEIISQVSKIYTGAKYITAIPRVRIIK